MSTFKQQIALDLDNILNADEISDDATFTPRTGTASQGKVVLNLAGGYSEGDWNGGGSLSGVAVMPKSSFPQKPQPHDRLLVGEREYLINSISDESRVAWVVSLMTDLRIR